MWGQSTENIKKIRPNRQYVQPRGDYAIGTCGPFTTETNVEALQISARVNTGCMSSTPIESLVKEAGLENLENSIRVRSICLNQKIKRLPSDNPARKPIIDKDVRTRLQTRKGEKRNSLKDEGRSTENTVRLRRVKFDDITTKDSFEPQQSVWNHSTSATHDDGSNRERETDKNKNEALETIKKIEEAVAISVYTDGSVTDSQKGGAGIALFRKVSDEVI